MKQILCLHDFARERIRSSSLEKTLAFAHAVFDCILKERLKANLSRFCDEFLRRMPWWHSLTMLAVDFIVISAKTKGIKNYG